ncbi:hypothetical protein CAG54_10540 [Vibrio sp. V27_P1S3P104]|nr:hypothetical protein [Vibrio sp. V28_P6S34P95]NAX06542.1 hypothetical protein [Vibrio sp. V30_P3S12P165]NAX37935.1 hypothetical protein [Vibrio sp. V27_P1S3P104]NNN43178.1 hypothetical protein [Vibrio sp. 1-1(7)]NNN71002.1 hypothetical protein [Vibrio sp. 12-2(3-a)]
MMRAIRGAHQRPTAVQICSRQICHSLAAYLQLQVVWIYSVLFKFVNDTWITAHHIKFVGQARQ